MSASSDFDADAMRERYLGEAAKQLYVFQRTPSSVDVRGNSVTDPAWASSLEPGWHKYRMENFNSLISGVPQEEDLVDDGWTDLIGKMVRRFREGADGKAQAAPYGGGSIQFFNLLAEWRNEGAFDGLKSGA